VTPEAEHHLHESPPSMVIPLVVLAVLSLVGGWAGPPLVGLTPFGAWLAPVFEGGPEHHLALPYEVALLGLSVAAAAIGVWAAFRFYLQKPDVATRLARRDAAPPPRARGRRDRRLGGVPLLPAEARRRDPARQAVRRAPPRRAQQVVDRR